MKNPKKLEGKTAFITGASSGIGRSAAYLFASEGADLVISARRRKRLDEISKDIKKKYGVKVKTMELDVRKYKDVKRAVDSLPARWKKIDILVNNAGLSRGLNKIQDGVLKDWEEMIDTNIKGLLYVSKEVISLMLENGRGHIINIGSIAGHEVYPGGNVYCATKFAVDAITKGMRIDLHETPIKVSTIDPGLTKTEFSIVRFRGDKEKAESVYRGTSPLAPDEVAEGILFAATCSDNMVVGEMILWARDQATATMVKRG